MLRGRTKGRLPDTKRVVAMCRVVGSGWRLGESQKLVMR